MWHPAVPRAPGTRRRIALLLAAGVLGVVGTARLLGPDDHAADRGLGSDSAVPVSPDAGDDGEAGTPAPPALVTSPGAPPPEQVADAFVSAWIDHRDIDPATWFARLRPYLTPSLAEQLAGADPASVPADRVTGATRLVPRAASLAEVTVPIDAGLLRLRLVATDGRWLVDSVDWERQ